MRDSPFEHYTEVREQMIWERTKKEWDIADKEREIARKDREEAIKERREAKREREEAKQREFRRDKWMKAGFAIAAFTLLVSLVSLAISLLG